MGSGNVKSQIQTCIFCLSLMLSLHCYINAVQLVWFGGIVSTWGEEFPAAVGMSIQSGQMQGEHTVNPSSAEEYRGERKSLSETTSYDALPIFLTKIQMQSQTWCSQLHSWLECLLKVHGRIEQQRAAECFHPYQHSQSLHLYQKHTTVLTMYLIISGYQNQKQFKFRHFRGCTHRTCFPFHWANFPFFLYVNTWKTDVFGRWTCLAFFADSCAWHGILKMRCSS